MGSLFLTQKLEKKADKVSPHFTYFNNHKKTKIFVGISCVIRDWDKVKKKVKRSDKDYKLKNLQIDTLRTKLETLVNRYKNNDALLSTEQLKLELKKREKVKETTSISSLPVFNLIKEWLENYMNNELIKQETRNSTKSKTNDVLNFIKEREKINDTLLIDDLDEEFSRDLMVWLFDKNLAPSSVEKRFGVLNQFCVWYSKVSKEYHKVEKPKELQKSVSIGKGEDKPFLKNEELQKIYNFTDFNFLAPKIKNGKTEWIESEDYYKHLKLKGDTRTEDNKDSIVEYIHDKTKYGLQTYTTYEVYKDLFVFLCSVGCRYSDGIVMKLENFYHGERSSNSTIKDGVEGFFKYYQKKTKTEAIPRVNEVSFEIYKKYSRGKKKGDYLFPLTTNGNFISDIKFNKHIKKICKIIGLNRPFVVRTIGSSGKELTREGKKLYEVMKSHVGRRTYIYNMVMDGNFTNNELMTMTGHKKTEVFQSYFKLKEEIHKKPNTPFLKLHKTIIKDDEEVEKLNVDGFTIPKKTLKQKLEELDAVKDMITKKEYDKMRSDLLKNPF